RVTDVLGALLLRLEHQRHLGPGVPESVVRDPGDVLEVLGVRRVRLVGPAAAGVRRERDVQHPARRRVTTYPQLAVGADVRKALVERTEPAVVDVPRRPAV